MLLLAGLALSMIGVAKFVLDKKKTHEQQLEDQQNKRQAANRQNNSDFRHSASQLHQKREGTYESR